MPLSVAALQYCASDDATATLAHIEPLIARAARTSKLICLPEAASFLAASRAQLAERAESEDDSVSQKRLAALARQHNVWLLAGSLFLRRRQDHKLVNRSVLFDPHGQIIASYDKIHMFDADVGDGRRYRESDNFRPGHKMVHAKTDIGHIGLSICYDIRFPDLYRKLGQQGVDIITIPAAFTQTTGQAHWHVLQRARAIETGSFVLAAAQCGVHADGRQTYGHSLIINPWGEVLADAGTMEEGFMIAEIDLSQVASARRKIRNLQHEPDYR